MIIVKRRYHPVSRFLIKIEPGVYYGSVAHNYGKCQGISENKNVNISFFVKEVWNNDVTAEDEPEASHKILETHKYVCAGKACYKHPYKLYRNKYSKRMIDELLIRNLCAELIKQVH
jgi:hypothetical protein